jgi:DnaJ-domain-containing protein 1
LIKKEDKDTSRNFFFDLWKDKTTWEGHKSDIHAEHEPAKESSLIWAYKALELTPTADKAIIRKQYLRLIQDYHPDKLIQGTSAMRKLIDDKAKEINLAYELLTH